MPDRPLIAILDPAGFVLGYMPRPDMKPDWDTWTIQISARPLFDPAMPVSPNIEVAQLVFRRRYRRDRDGWGYSAYLETEAREDDLLNVRGFVRKDFF